ncbi:MAG: NAD(P)H-hydrate dehydratase [Bacillota bacterium]|nr:NAD(P)H-hydrate dehydratase [Bacillota bacterium]
MRLIDGECSRSMDREAMEQYGLDTLVLMENAGLRAADLIAKQFPQSHKKIKISVVIGKGNNGGDALVVARHLFNRGYDVQMFCPYRPTDFSPAASANFRITDAMGIPMKYITTERELLIFKVMLLSSHCIVDGIFGSGFHGVMTGIVADMVNVINESKRPVFALDIPSGVDGDTGAVEGVAIRASYTIAFALPKRGNILSPGGGYNGVLRVVDISFPPSLMEEKENDDIVIDESWALTKLHPRKAESHKGLFGHVLVAGGSDGMAGSLILAGKGALKSGSGLVTYMMPKSLYPAVASHNMEAMTLALPENEEGSLTEDSADLLLKQTGNKILVMGMGLSRHEDSKNFVKKVLDHYNCPMVMDADALMALGDLGERKKNAHPLILTPHPGEMARLLGWTIREVQENRLNAVLNAAKKYDAVVVLKGNKTLIATANGKLMVNLTGNAGMATGGMGDVLAGIIGGLLGQGLDAATAAALGVYFHGLAGDRAAADKGQMSLNAGDIIEYLPKVLLDYEMKLKEADSDVL